MVNNNQQTINGNITTVTTYNKKEMITYIRQNRSVASDIHRHIIHSPYEFLNDYELCTFIE